MPRNPAWTVQIRDALVGEQPVMADVRLTVDPQREIIAIKLREDRPFYLVGDGEGEPVPCRLAKDLAGTEYLEPILGNAYDVIAKKALAALVLHFAYQADE